MDAPKDAPKDTPAPAAKKDEVEKPHPYDAKLLFILTWPRSGLSLDQRFALCRSIGAECIQDEELRYWPLYAKPLLTCAAAY